MDVMDNLLQELYEKYEEVFRNLLIGHPLSARDLNEMWNIIHRRHFVKHENDAPIIFNILEYYEYI